MAYNPNNATHVQRLQTELAKPEYTSVAQTVGDEGLARMLNTPKEGLRVRRKSVPSSELMAAIDFPAWGGITAASRDYIQAHLTAGDLDLTSASVRQGLVDAFPSNATNDPTRARMQNFGEIAPASPAQDLFGYDARITALDVANALRPPMLMGDLDSVLILDRALVPAQSRRKKK
jgi:hypothetical protein